VGVSDELFAKSLHRGGSAGAPNSYTASFAATENPINQNGIWLSGGINDGRTDVQTDGTHAFGTQFSFDGTNYTDSVACLANWSSDDHQITATIAASGIGALALEVELALRCQMNATLNCGIEVDIGNYAGGQMQLVRWNGPKNNFTLGPLYTTNVSLVDGAVWVASVKGYFVTVTCNGLPVATNVDIRTAFGAGGLVIAHGVPGMGFVCNTGNPDDRTKFGWKAWSALAI
jgi:hypothetical protein